MRGQGPAWRAAAALLLGRPPAPPGAAAAATPTPSPSSAPGARLVRTSGRAEGGDRQGAGDWSTAGRSGLGGGAGGGFAQQLSSGHSAFGAGTAVDFYSLAFDSLWAIELERPHLLHGHGAGAHGIGSTAPREAAGAAAAAGAATAAAEEEAAQAEAEAEAEDFYDSMHDFSEEHTLVLRSAWFCSGAQDLSHMREQLERRIRFLSDLEEDGWELASPVGKWVCLTNAAPKPRGKRRMPDAWAIVEEWQALSAEAGGSASDEE